MKAMPVLSKEKEWVTVRSLSVGKRTATASAARPAFRSETTSASVFSGSSRARRAGGSGAMRMRASAGTSPDASASALAASSGRNGARTMATIHPHTLPRRGQRSLARGGLGLARRAQRVNVGPPPPAASPPMLTASDTAVRSVFQPCARVPVAAWPGSSAVRAPVPFQSGHASRGCNPRAGPPQLSAPVRPQGHHAVELDYDAEHRHLCRVPAAPGEGELANDRVSFPAHVLRRVIGCCAANDEYSSLASVGSCCSRVHSSAGFPLVRRAGPPLLVEPLPPRGGSCELVVCVLGGGPGRGAPIEPLATFLLKFVGPVCVDTPSRHSPLHEQQGWTMSTRTSTTSTTSTSTQRKWRSPTAIGTGARRSPTTTRT